MSYCAIPQGDVEFCGPPRRGFLSRMLAAGLGGLGSSLLRGSTPAKKILPAIELGGKSVSRLIAGANPIGGWSYGTRKLTQHMLNYFTVERTTKFILHCEQEGITTWQSHYSTQVRDALLAARERGSKIQWIVLTTEREGALKDVLTLHPIAVCHHGGATDSLFRAGQQERIHDFVKTIHDAGILAGVSTHNPDHLLRVEDAGWENEFYMTCFYNLTRTPEEKKKLLAEEILGDLFFASDPQRMVPRIRQVKKPCLAYKILGAGRLCANSSAVERAFAFAYANIKPFDAVIVGMYPVFADEVQEDADFARKYRTAS